MRHPLLAIAFLCIFFGACTKKDVPYGFPVSEYTKLTPGNYWIYESFVVDSNDYGVPGSQNGTGVIYYDSVYVEKDMVIGKYTYHKVMKPIDAGASFYQPTYLRDSLNYLVTNYGTALFSSLNTNTAFYSRTVAPSNATADSASYVELVTGDVNERFTTPAGTFTTIATIANWTFYPFAASGNAIYHHRQYFRYTPGIGMVSESLTLDPAIPTYTERRLLRYHVQ